MNTPKYPWDIWFKAGIFTLKLGVDFRCRPHGMAQQIRNAATRLGLRVSIKHLDDSTIETRVVG